MSGISFGLLLDGRKLPDENPLGGTIRDTSRRLLYPADYVTKIQFGVRSERTIKTGSRALVDLAGSQSSISRWLCRARGLQFPTREATRRGESGEFPISLFLSLFLGDINQLCPAFQDGITRIIFDDLRGLNVPRRMRVIEIALRSAEGSRERGRERYIDGVHRLRDCRSFEGSAKISRQPC